MLTTHEAQAHLVILGTIALIKSARLHRNYAPHAFRPPLEAIRPRCNCGHVLEFSALKDGLRMVWCAAGCGMRFRECTELAAHARR